MSEFIKFCVGVMVGMSIVLMSTGDYFLAGVDGLLGLIMLLMDYALTKDVAKE